MWEIGSGLSALLGALVGGGVTLIGTWLTLRATREEHQEKRRFELADRQIARHEQLMVDLSALDEAARPVIASLQAGSIDEQANANYESTWEQSSVSRAQARFAGPPELQEALNKALSATEEFVNKIDDWRDNGEALTPQQVRNLRQRYREARSVYADAASRILMPRAHLK